MENYTKYALKSADELAQVLAGTDKAFVIACNKCFKEFETTQEPDCDTFKEIAASNGKTITGSAAIDFLCNKTQTLKKFEDLSPKAPRTSSFCPAAWVFRLLRTWLRFPSTQHATL